jgi:hypothetical protein
MDGRGSDSGLARKGAKEAPVAKFPKVFVRLGAVCAAVSGNLIFVHAGARNCTQVHIGAQLAGACALGCSPG